MNDEEPQCLVCMRADGATGDVVTDSTEAGCAACGAPVLIAPTGQAFLAAHADVRVLCVTCAAPKIKDDTPLFTVPGSMAELEASMSPAEMARVRLVMKMLGIKPDDGSSRPPQPHKPTGNDIQKGNHDQEN